MSDRQRDLIGFVGAAFAVMVGLFVLQELVRTWGDSRLHAGLAHAARHPDALAAAERDAKALAAGKMPIEAAMQALATQGRSSFPSIAAKPSEDVSALSGWVHRHGFAPYVPRAPEPPSAVPAFPQAAPVEGADGAAPAEPPAEGGAAAAAPTAPAEPAAPAPKPAVEEAKK